MNANTTTPGDRTHLVEVTGLRKAYGGRRVLDDVSLEVRPSETVCLLGPSGTGKTTLLRCLNLLETPDAGRIRIADAQYDAGSRGKERAAQVKALRRTSGMIFQQFNLWPHMTVTQNLIEGPVRVNGMPREQALSRAAELLDRVRMTPWADAYPEQLSGGQQQRVGIARALAMDPVVLLCDEPTSSLDPELVGEVQDVLKDLADKGLTMVAVTHEISFAAEIADRVVFMDQGRIVEEGPADQVLGDPQEARTRDFLHRARR